MALSEFKGPSGACRDPIETPGDMAHMKVCIVGASGKLGQYMA